MKLSKTLLVILFISLLSSQSWSETRGDLVERENILYLKFSDVPFTGEISGNHVIFGDVRGSVKNGKRVGAWVAYYGNGQLKEKGNYKNGKRDGVWVAYDIDGTINKSRTGTFKDDVKISD